MLDAFEFLLFISLFFLKFENWVIDLFVIGLSFRLLQEKQWFFKRGVCLSRRDKVLALGTFNVKESPYYSLLHCSFSSYPTTKTNIIIILITIISLTGTINMEGGKHELVELLATRTCIWERSVSISFSYHSVY